MESVQEPCVLLKYTPNTAEQHPHLLDETPVGTGDTDGGRKEKKKTGFWRWPSLHFPCRMTGKYDLVKAEKDYQIEAGIFQRVSHRPDETNGGKEEAGKEEKKKKSFWKWLALHFPYHRSGTYNLAQAEKQLKDEEQREQDVPDKGHINRHYKIGPKLGEGSFPFVYEGTRRKDGLQAAVTFSVKSPHMPAIKVPGYKKQLPVEIGPTIMANKGPSVPQINKLLDWEDDTDHFIMVMERPVPCMDMFSFVNFHGGSLDEKTARVVMRQVICERGVFHRDIKLANLLVNLDTMEVKLIDSGCGVLMRKNGFKVFTGTREYFPPEFEVDGRYHAKPTTVWSLGILLFILVCGALPSPGDLYMTTANLWTGPGLSQECCQMICDRLQPKPQERLALEEMQLNDWFKVVE